MISSFDYYKQIESPDMYLCNPDKRYICALNAEDRHLVLRFNDLSELTFTVPKIQGAEDGYNLVESMRLIFVEKIGWFQIESANETICGNTYTKDVTARSHQYALKNRGFVSEERVYMFYNPNDPLDAKYDSGNKAAIPSVVGQLCRQVGIKLALSMSDVETTEDKIDWTIIYIDPVLKFRSRSYGAMYEGANGIENVCRGFKANKDLNGYDFIFNTVESAFEVIFEFDCLYHTIKIKTLADITKPTDIYLSFDNIINTLKVKEDSENIVTVMSCIGGDLDIRTVNPMGTNYIVDFDYYKKEKSDDGKVDYPWMSEELIDALDEWKADFAERQNEYSPLVINLQALYVDKLKADEDIRFSNLKLTDMQVARDQYINKDDEANDGAGIITGETVAVAETSVKGGTMFNLTPFSDDAIITGHIDAPDMSKGEDGIYTFTFSDAGVSGTAGSLIQDYYDEESGFDDVEVPLYFMDEDSRSYCKLNVASILEIAKDSDGNPSDFSYKSGDSWKTKTGCISLGETTFTVTKEKVTDTYVISAEDWSLEFESNTYFIYNGERYRIVASADGIVSLYCFYVSGFDRATTYRETAGVGGWCDLWEVHINSYLVPKVKAINEQIDALTKEMGRIGDLCNIQKFVKRKGDALYNELSNYWIEGEYKNDNIAVQDSTTMSERIDLAKELMKAGEADLKKSAQPQFEMSADAINFIKMYEFRQFTNELALGRTITIEKEDGVYYQPALMTLEYDIDTSENFTMTFSNASKPWDVAMTFADLIKESSSSARTVAANWSDLTDYSRNKDQITRLIDAPLDRSLRAMQADMAAQAFIIDDSGILGRKYDKAFGGASGTFLPEQVRIINNTIVFTKDNWETAALALGKTDYGYGLVADVLVGELILGERISIGSKSERVRIDNGGILIKNDNKDTVFEADADGNITLKGSVYATDGEFSGKIIASDGTIGGYEIGKTTLKSGGVGMSSNCEPGSYAFWAGNAIPENAPFYVTNAGALHGTSGTIGGFTIGNESIYNERASLDSDKGTGVYLGTDGISFGYDTTLKTPKICASKDGKFSALDATISGEARLTTCVTGGKMGDKPEYGITANTGLINYLSTPSLSAGTIKFADTDYKLRTGNLGETFHTAEITLGNYNSITVTCKDGKSPYNVIGDKSFTVNWETSGYPIKTGSVTITVKAGTSSTTLKQVVVMGPLSTATFDSSGGTTAIFSEGTSEGFIFNGNLLPEANVSYDLGDANHYWKNIYCKKSAVELSDANEKHEIKRINEKYDAMFDALVPVTYIFNNSTNSRTHLGLTAQNLKESILNAGLTTKECAAYAEWVKDDGDIGRGIRYGELISLCIHEIQSLKQKIATLEPLENF